MSKTLVCVNVLDNVNAQVYGSHCQEWFNLGRHSSDEFILFHPNRLSIDNARNQAAQIALQLECDYIYFVDDDIILSPKTYNSLKNCNADVAQALTFIRGYPFHCMAFKNGTSKGSLDYFDDYSDWVTSQGVFEAEAVGFSCALIRCEVLKKIQYPYFITSTMSTEDVYFCLKLRQRLGSSVLIVVDTKVPTQHLLHPESVSVYNVKDRRFNGKNKNGDPKNEDRGEEYLQKCRQVLKTQLPLEKD